MNKVTVLGSMNLDTVLRMEKLPRPGETVHSKEVFTSGGGKGANQAIAAQRSKAEISFIGAVGKDESGELLIELLAQDGVDVSQISRLEKERTGSAIVMVDDSGENSIVIHSGANDHVSLRNKKTMEIIENSDFLVSQFEINTDVIIEAFKIAKKAGVKTVLNPAPAMVNIPEELLKNTDILIPNQTETESITGMKLDAEEHLQVAGKKIQAQGVELVIITLGQKGAYFMNDSVSGIIPAQVVNAIDTTAAGDTFIGALIAVLAKDYQNLQEAISYASHASALTVQRLGAQPSIPYQEEINLTL